MINLCKPRIKRKETLKTAQNLTSPFTTFFKPVFKKSKPSCTESTLDLHCDRPAGSVQEIIAVHFFFNQTEHTNALYEHKSRIFER